MDVRITVEPTFDDGEKRIHQLDGVSRPYRMTCLERTGLRPEDGKRVAERFRQTSLCDQVEEITRESRVCPAFSLARAIHVAPGLAAFAAVGQNLTPRLRRPAERGDQEDAIRQEIVGALLDDRDHATRLVPTVGLIPQFMEPGPGISRAAARRTLHEWFRRPVRHGIGAQTRDTVDPACIKARQQRCPRQARIDARPAHGWMAANPRSGGCPGPNDDLVPCRMLPLRLQTGCPGIGPSPRRAACTQYGRASAPATGFPALGSGCDRCTLPAQAASGKSPLPSAFAVGKNSM